MKNRNKTLASSWSKIWIWHLPFGINETHIVQHFEERGFLKSEIKLAELRDKAGKFAGYELDIPDRQKEVVDATHKLPPGWCVKQLKSQLTIDTDSKLRNFEDSLSPTYIRLCVSVETSEETIIQYIASKNPVITYQSILI